MKPVTSTPNIQNEAMSNAVKIKGKLSCILSGESRDAQGATIVSIETMAI